MSNITCLYGPPFSLVDNSLPNNQVVNFQVDFDSPADQESVIAYEWYLDDFLLIEEMSSQFTANTTAGTHRIGVRILTSSGWSGVKNLDFEKV